MSAQLDAIVHRGRAMAEFCARVRERGGRAEVEEDEDLPLLRVLFIVRRTAERLRRGVR